MQYYPNTVVCSGLSGLVAANELLDQNQSLLLIKTPGHGERVSDFVSQKGLEILKKWGDFPFFQLQAAHYHFKEETLDYKVLCNAIPISNLEKKLLQRYLEKGGHLIEESKSCHLEEGGLITLSDDKIIKTDSLLIDSDRYHPAAPPFFPSYLLLKCDYEHLPAKESVDFFVLPKAIVMVYPVCEQKTAVICLAHYNHVAEDEGSHDSGHLFFQDIRCDSLRLQQRLDGGVLNPSSWQYIPLRRFGKRHMHGSLSDTYLMGEALFSLPPLFGKAVEADIACGLHVAHNALKKKQTPFSIPFLWGIEKLGKAWLNPNWQPLVFACFDSFKKSVASWNQKWDFKIQS